MASRCQNYQIQNLLTSIFPRVRIGTLKIELLGWIMKVYLFRHAQKSSTPWDNPPLSDYGFSQSLMLADIVVNRRKLEIPQHLLCSPKLRCQQSLAPLARVLDCQIEVQNILDERDLNESYPEFSMRVRDFLDSLTEKAAHFKGCFYLCSHLDWIEEALIRIPCDRDLLALAQWPPLSYIAFEIEGGLWKFIEFKPIEV